MTIPLSEILEEACAPKEEPPVILMSDLTHLDGTPLTDEEQSQLQADSVWSLFCEQAQSSDDGHTPVR